MIHAGIKDIKNNLSRFIAQVKAGEEVMITERGKPVARIIKENSKNLAVRKALMPWIEKGLVVLPTTRLEKNAPARYEVSGKPVSEMVIEDRR